MRQKSHKAGDLVCAPQASLLHTGGTTIKLEEPTLLLVADHVADGGALWCPVIYKGHVWSILKKDLYEPRRKDGDKTC